MSLEGKTQQLQRMGRGLCCVAGRGDLALRSAQPLDLLCSVRILLQATVLTNLENRA